MTWVKVCGITDEQALDAAVEAGADAVGFVLIEGSPRKLAEDAARTLIARSPIPSFILTDSSDVDRVLRMLERTGATGIQPYGSSTHQLAEVAAAAGLDVLFPVAIGGNGLPEDLAIPESATPLFDTASADRLGGTGRTFPWEYLARFESPFVLAGGLGPDNVAEAIRTVRPFGVDASSRLETSPGVKDPDTIRAYVQEAKAI